MNNITIINYENLTSEERKNLTEESIKRIEVLSENIKTSFVELGYHFKIIKESKGYLELGYNSLDEFSEDKFNLKSTSVKYMISVFDKFGEVINGVPMIASEFKEYNYGQLTEFVPIVNSVKAEEQEEKKKEILQQFPSEMSAKEIRKKRQTPKETKKVEVSSKTVSQPTDQNNTKINTTYKSSSGFETVIKNYLDDLSSKDESFKNRYENPNKNIKDCCKFIISEVYKKKVNVMTNDEVFGLAIHYYDEEKVNIQNINANVVITEGV